MRKRKREKHFGRSGKLNSIIWQFKNNAPIAIITKRKESGEQVMFGDGNESRVRLEPGREIL